MPIVLTLFFTFLNIGFLSIGGGYAIIPLIQEQVVDNLKWISLETFTHIITISQMTPGPLAINTSTFVGLQIAGIFGAIAATVGAVISGIIISILLYRFFLKHKASDYISYMIEGLRSASLGLIICAAASIVSLALFGSGSLNLLALTESLNFTALFVFLVMLIIIRKYNKNPILIMLLSALAGLIFYR